MRFRPEVGQVSDLYLLQRRLLEVFVRKTESRRTKDAADRFVILPHCAVLSSVGRSTMEFSAVAPRRW
jgi:hypothetical protein